MLWFHALWPYSMAQAPVIGNLLGWGLAGVVLYALTHSLCRKVAVTSERGHGWSFPALALLGWLPLLAHWAGFPLFRILAPLVSSDAPALGLWHAAFLAPPMLCWAWWGSRALASGGPPTQAVLLGASLGALAAHVALSLVGALWAQGALTLFHVLTLAQAEKSSDLPSGKVVAQRIVPLFFGVAAGLTLALFHRLFTVASSSWAYPGAALWAGAFLGMAWSRGRVLEQEKSLPGSAARFALASLALAVLAAYAGRGLAFSLGEPRSAMTALVLVPAAAFLTAAVSVRLASCAAGRNGAAFCGGAAAGALALLFFLLPTLGALRAAAVPALVALLAAFFGKRFASSSIRMERVFAALAFAAALVWLARPPIPKPVFFSGMDAAGAVQSVTGAWEDAEHSVGLWVDWRGERHVAVDGDLGIPYGNTYLASVAPILAHGEARRAALIWPRNALTAAGVLEAGGVEALALVFPSPAWTRGASEILSFSHPKTGVDVQTGNFALWAARQGGFAPAKSGFDVVRLPPANGMTAHHPFLGEEFLLHVRGAVRRDGFVVQSVRMDLFGRAALRQFLRAYTDAFPNLYSWSFADPEVVMSGVLAPRPFSYKRLVEERFIDSPLNRRLADYRMAVPYNILENVVDGRESILPLVAGVRPLCGAGVPWLALRRPAEDRNELYFSDENKGPFRIPLKGYCHRGLGRVNCPSMAAEVELPRGWSVSFEGLEWRKGNEWRRGIEWGKGNEVVKIVALRAPGGGEWRLTVLLPQELDLSHHLIGQLQGSLLENGNAVFGDVPGLWALEKVHDRLHAVGVAECPESDFVYAFDYLAAPGESSQPALDAMRFVRWRCFPAEP
ncbi:MAG: hypothetical protein JSV08_03330 [Acidobacteriota bacterium]|nr:MAG: hypothetical protein JSV08_07515 [Acidobacteriota bacterium]UCF81454.1 MAG: hypothetical protein JSV08_03330 [Acidobacteriota bacterium]